MGEALRLGLMLGLNETEGCIEVVGADDETVGARIVGNLFRHFLFGLNHEYDGCLAFGPNEGANTSLVGDTVVLGCMVLGSKEGVGCKVGDVELVDMLDCAAGESVFGLSELGSGVVEADEIGRAEVGTIVLGSTTFSGAAVGPAEVGVGLVVNEFVGARIVGLAVGGLAVVGLGLVRLSLVGLAVDVKAVVGDSVVGSVVVGPAESGINVVGANVVGKAVVGAAVFGKDGALDRGLVILAPTELLVVGDFIIDGLIDGL